MLRLGGAVRTRREGRLVICSLDLETIKRHQAELSELLGLGRIPGRSQEVST
jgi:hypothetical protein